MDRGFWERHVQLLQQLTFAPKLGRPWLFYSGEGFGCEACQACGFQTPWGLGTIHAHNWQLQWRRHAASTKHEAAVDRTHEAEAEHMLGSQPPSHDEFKQVLTETLANGATDICGMAGIGGRKKVRKVQYCLAEIMRRIQRKFWEKCSSMTISQDKRGTRLLARWRACTPDLVVRTGVAALLTDSEFPMFELCASFAVFNLNVHAQVNLQGSSNWRSRALVKLARVFNIEPADDVLLQFFDLFPIAQNAFSKEGATNAEAWSLAVGMPTN